jgi:hypothetical protein
MIRVRVGIAPRSQPFDEAMDSLMAAIRFAADAGISVTMEKVRGGAPGFQNYGPFIAHMLESDETHLFIAADDVLYPPDAITRLVNADKDVICGIYRKNMVNDICPANFGDGTAESFLARLKDGGIYPTNLASAHSMTIRRGVLEKMILDYPELAYRQGESLHYALFLPMIHDQTCFQDDWSFSLRARRSGFTLWDDYGCKLKHFCSDFLGFEALEGRQ